MIKSLPSIANLTQQLITSEARLSAIFHHSPIAIAYTDINLKVLKTNDQFLYQFGYNEDIYSLCNLLSQSSKQGFCTKDHCLNRISQQKNVEYIIETRHKKGHILWVHIRGTVINYDNSKQEVLWLLEDITSLREEQEQRQLAETVFEVSGEAMAIIDNTGKFEKINSAMQHLTEYSALELYKHSVTKLFNSHTNPCSINEILNIVSIEGQWKGELWIRQKNQSLIPTQLTLNSIKRSNGEISHIVAILTDISKFKAQEQVLKYRANHDPLTGLANRNEFFVRLNDSLAAAKRHQYKVALFYLDLDGFKPINDTLGHGKGDEILQQVAIKLKSHIREVDTVARIGGDEFAIILNGTSEKQISSTAKRIIQSISIHVENSLYLSVSIGIALFPKDATNPLKLLQYADEAMYKAKQQGKQSYCWHCSE